MKKSPYDNDVTNPYLKVTYKTFLGKNNVDEPISLAKVDQGATYLITASNVDIINGNKITLRDGETLLEAGDFKSVWSNRKKRYGIKDSDLVEISNAGESSVIMASVGDSRMVFADTEGSGVYFTNGIIIGKITTSANLLTNSSTKDFKAVMPSGQDILYANGSIHIARRNVIYISDIGNKDVYDTRSGFKQMENVITGIGHIPTGFFISDELGIYFVEGKDLYKNLPRKRLLNIPAYRYSMKNIYDITTPKGQYFQQALAWACRDGIYLGGEGGYIENLTPTYNIQEGTEAVITQRVSGALRQLIIIIR